MFTGLVRELGVVKSYKNSVLCIEAKHTPLLGDSIAINGTCLTVVALGKTTFDVELSSETKTNIAYENLKDKVHLEPAMTLKDRLDGHLVQGHIDGIGEIENITKNQNSIDLHVSIPPKLMPLMMPKGSVAIDGISLTINEVLDSSIRLTIIPHTFKNTLFPTYKIKRRVNIESDMFARYIYRILNHKKELSWDDVDKMMSLY